MYSILTKLVLATSALFIVPPIPASRDVPCKALMDSIRSGSFALDKVTPWPEESFVVSVQLYLKGNRYYAIAELVVDKEGSTRKYVYCDIPKSDWSDFEWEIIDQDLSFNAKFRKYIHIHKCECD